MNHLRSLVALLVVLSVMPGVALGQNTSDPYNGTDANPQAGWLDGLTEGTLDDLVGLVVRGVGYFVGGGPSAGAAVTALILGVIVMGVVGYNRSGIAVGGVATVGAAWALGTAGLLPSWVYPVVLMLIGLVVFVAYKRLVR